MDSSRSCFFSLLFFSFFLFCQIVVFPFSVAAATSGDFTGTWVANGAREVLEFGEGRTTSLLSLVGHVNLKNEVGDQKDYWARCIGLSDTELGGDLRCVWTGSEGQEVYVTLSAGKVREGQAVSGKIVGGTGSAKGIRGELSFTWTTLSFEGETGQTSVGGYTNDLTGRYTLP